MPDLYPMLIQPRFSERLWGGRALATKLGKAAPSHKPIGESWEIFEENTVLNGPYTGLTIGELRGRLGRDLTGHVSPDELFPLLTKLIDAQDVLSVQVHPDDHYAREHEGQPYGKTECWYVIDAAPGAELTYGFSRNTDPEEYTRLVAQGTLDEILRPLRVAPGDVIYLPAGTVHAIGKGIMVYEVQQTSDVTYRIFDWNRRDSEGKPRELHVEQAKAVLDYHGSNRGVVHWLEQVDSGRAMLVAGPYFCLELMRAGTVGVVSTYDSAVAVCTLDRPLMARVGDTAVLLPRYSSLLIPAAAGTYSLESVGDDMGAEALVSYVPASQATVRADLAERGFSLSEIEAFMAQFAPATDLGNPAR